MTFLPHSKILGTLALSAVCLFPTSANAATTVDNAVAWWTLETDTTGTNSIDLSAVASTTSGLTPIIPATFANATGVTAGNAGAKAIDFDGSTVLKSNSPSLRIGGAQTFWLRVNFSSVTGSFALMDRSRSTSGQRGISLQMSNGKLQAYASEDAQTYQAQLTGSNSYTLSIDTWYDIALRFIPSVSLRVDLYDPTTGLLIDYQEITTNIPASIVTTNSIGSGYFQIGGLNNGSAGSSLVLPDGTLIEAAGVWDSALSDAQLAELSASSIPEPASTAWWMGGLAILLTMASRRRRVA